jgi:stress response protein YsnF
VSPSPTPTSTTPCPGRTFSDEEHEVVLHEEQPLVSKKAVPKERVRLATETVTDDRQVTEDVRKERIEAEGDATRDR